MYILLILYVVHVVYGVGVDENCCVLRCVRDEIAPSLPAYSVYEVFIIAYRNACMCCVTLCLLRSVGNLYLYSYCTMSM